MLVRQKLRFLPGKTAELRVRDNSIKRYIPRIWLNFLDFLAAKGNANQFRANPISTMSKMGETTIVIRASHADAIAVLVECNSRRYYHVELSRIDEEATHRFPNAKLILFQFRVRSHFAKCHFGARAQNRYENALVCPPASLDDFSCIDFVMHWQETRYRVARIPGSSRANAIANDFGCALTILCRHIAAGAQGASAE